MPVSDIINKIQHEINAINGKIFNDEEITDNDKEILSMLNAFTTALKFTKAAEEEELKQPTADYTARHIHAIITLKKPIDLRSLLWGLMEANNTSQKAVAENGKVRAGSISDYFKKKKEINTSTYERMFSGLLSD